MRKINIRYIALIAAMAAFTSCEDMFGGYLDKQPSNELTEEETFGSWTNTEQFHFDTYNFLRAGACRINSSWMDSATDLGHTSYSYAGTRVSFNIGNYYASGAANELTDTWEHYYRGIRKCNMLLEHIDAVPKSADDTEEAYERLLKIYKAEARFFRAYFHWELFLRYGPVPIIKETLDPDGDLISIGKERPTVKEFVQDFVLEELIGNAGCMSDLLTLDEVRADLENLGGRITQPVALALANRIQLYMASPMYNYQTGITWNDVIDSAEKFIKTYGPNGTSSEEYSLYNVSPDVPSLNYQNAILTTATEQGKNPEIIFWRNSVPAGWNDIVNDTPVGEGGNGGLCPSQNLVDMYDMIDGTSPFAEYDETGAPVYEDNGSGVPSPKVATGSRYNEANPCSSRDPRLSASVLYNGSTWGDGVIDVIKGHRDNPLGNANSTPTGYYLRKYMPESILTNNHSGTGYRNWIFIRYAEILLNYAEALCETGRLDEALETIQPIRNRVGLALDLKTRTDLETQDQVRNFIRKERTVELAFEDHRAWDVRRWNVAEKSLGRDIYGMEVTQENGKLKYTRKVVANRVFETKMYFYPIPEAEVWKSGIKNNPGW